ncbi:unnamed protein product [Peniophora sp. CBMAI 1063]|nr:unnamed protein product [Peniophora sp. CBMAI 1063]
MSGYKSFAIVGAGLIGGTIAEELLKAKTEGVVDKIVLLSRPNSVSKLDTYSARGATVVPVEDYSSVQEVSKALSGVEVVFSTLSHLVLDLELPIAEAAKAAGAQLFVPSEYGLSTDGHTNGILASKAAVDKQIRALGIATTRFFVGMFGDIIWSPFLGLDLKGTVLIGGDGSAKVSFTSTEDIGRFVVFVLTKLSREEVKNRTFRIEGERTSYNDIFAAYEKKHGVQVTVQHVPIEDMEATVAKDSHDVVTYLRLAWAKGAGTVGSPLDNGVFPDWNPRPVIHYL